MCNSFHNILRFLEPGSESYAKSRQKQINETSPVCPVPSGKQVKLRFEEDTICRRPIERNTAARRERNSCHGKINTLTLSVYNYCSLLLQLSIHRSLIFTMHM